MTWTLLGLWLGTSVVVGVLLARLFGRLEELDRIARVHSVVRTPESSVAVLTLPADTPYEELVRIKEEFERRTSVGEVVVLAGDVELTWVESDDLRTPPDLRRRAPEQAGGDGPRTDEERADLRLVADSEWIGADGDAPERHLSPAELDWASGPPSWADAVRQSHPSRQEAGVLGRHEFELRAARADRVNAEAMRRAQQQALAEVARGEELADAQHAGLSHPMDDTGRCVLCRAPSQDRGRTCHVRVAEARRLLAEKQAERRHRYDEGRT